MISKASKYTAQYSVVLAAVVADKTFARVSNSFYGRLRLYVAELSL